MHTVSTAEAVAAGAFVDLALFFRNEVKPALGCTEPGAVAYAASIAARHCPGEPLSVALSLSLSMFKNGRDVGIPGTGGLRGNRLAAVLGVLAGDADKGLMALEHIDMAVVERAQTLLDAGMVTEEVVDGVPGVYAAVTLRCAGHEVTVTVAGRHDRVASIVVDGEVVGGEGMERAPEADGTLHGGASCEPSASFTEPPLPAYLEELRECDFAQLWDMAAGIDATLEQELLRGAAMNMAVARMGLESGWGLGVGHTLAAHAEAADLHARIRFMAGAAADVRMAGAPQPVMSSAGSGNHGITATVPVAVAAEGLGVSPRVQAEALALSHLVTGYLKAHTGRLTPICGCSVAAGAGAAAGIVKVLGGNAVQAERAVASLMASLMGMLCDGAKGSCGLKVATAAGEAYAAALLGMDDRGVQRPEGVVNPDIATTARALARLSREGFAAADAVMVELLGGGKH